MHDIHAALGEFDFSSVVICEMEIVINRPSSVL